MQFKMTLKAIVANKNKEEDRCIYLFANVYSSVVALGQK